MISMEMYTTVWVSLVCLEIDGGNNGMICMLVRMVSRKRSFWLLPTFYHNNFLLIETYHVRFQALIQDFLEGGG